MLRDDTEAKIFGALKFETIWNNLKQFETILKQFETIWNNLKQFETIWNIFWNNFISTRHDTGNI